MDKNLNTKLRPIIILVAILMLPGFLYYMLTLKGENRYKPLPIFGPKSLTGTSHSFRGKKIPDTLYHQVQNYTFTNQNEQLITDTAYKNKVKVLSFFYIGCAGACQKVLHEIARADSNYVQNDKVRFMTISINPKQDDQKAIQQYLKKYPSGSKKWDWLTGNPAQTDSLLHHGLMLDGGNIDGQWVLSNKIVLLDDMNRIRGYYDGTFQPDLDRLNDEIKVLIVEQLRNIKEFKE